MSDITTGGIITSILAVFGIGINQHVRIKRLEQKEDANCSVGRGIRKDVERLKRQAPSGDATCASESQITELKADMKEGFKGIHERLDNIFSKRRGD